MSGRQRAGLAQGPGAKARYARIKRLLAGGELPLAALLEGSVRQDDERDALNMTLGALLRAGGIDDPRAEQLALDAEIERLNIRLRDLPTARRQALARALRAA